MLRSQALRRQRSVLCGISERPPLLLTPQSKAVRARADHPDCSWTRPISHCALQASIDRSRLALGRQYSAPFIQAAWHYYLTSKAAATAQERLVWTRLEQQAELDRERQVHDAYTVPVCGQCFIPSWMGRRDFPHYGARCTTCQQMTNPRYEQWRVIHEHTLQTR